MRGRFVFLPCLRLSSLCFCCCLILYERILWLDCRRTRCVCADSSNDLSSICGCDVEELSKSFEVECFKLVNVCRVELCCLKPIHELGSYYTVVDSEFELRVAVAVAHIHSLFCMCAYTEA